VQVHKVIWHKEASSPHAHSFARNAIDFCDFVIIFYLFIFLHAFNALTLLVARQEGHQACKN